MVNHVQLNNIAHKDIRIRTERSAELGDAVMASPLFPHEFREAQAYYPIVFAKEKSGKFRPLALFGLEDGSNLFLSEHGWDARYLPLTRRMEPFVIGLTTDSLSQQSMEVHIDIDHRRVSEDEGEALFLEQGGHTDYLRGVAELLGEIHEAEQALAGFTAMLGDLELLEPFTLDIQLDNGEAGRLEGFYIIAEERLYNLEADKLAGLQQAGFLQPLYMAVASLSQFVPLIDRKNKAG